MKSLFSSILFFVALVFAISLYAKFQEHKGKKVLNKILRLTRNGIISAIRNEKYNAILDVDYSQIDLLAQSFTGQHSSHIHGKNSVSFSFKEGSADYFITLYKQGGKNSTSQKTMLRVERVLPQEERRAIEKAKIDALLQKNKRQTTPASQRVSNSHPSIKCETRANPRRDNVQSRDARQQETNNPLRQAIESRGVRYLVHFTQESNIDSIIKYGLVPKSMFSILPIPGTCNDELRLDSKEDACCFSIGFPNNLMFYKYRKITEAQGIEWAVIVLNKEVMIDKDCLFCFTNAASNSIRQLDMNSLRGVNAFRKLYADGIGESTRKELGLPDDWPTDPQAEVLVKGIVEPRYILGIMFNNEAFAAKYKLKHPQLDIRANRFFYNTRDYSLQRTQRWQ